METPTSFDHYIESKGVVFAMFPPPREFGLSLRDMIEQAVMVRQVFHGSWPSRG